MRRIMFALMLMTLASCKTSGDLQLPPIPADIKATLEHQTARPKAGAMTSKRAFQLIAELKASEVAKTAAGKRLIALWEARMAGDKTP